MQLIYPPTRMGKGGNQIGMGRVDKKSWHLFRLLRRCVNKQVNEVKMMKVSK
jgi:hypothetical protein